LPFDEALTYALIVLGLILTSSIIIYTMRRLGKKDEKPSEEESKLELKGLPFKIVKSVSNEGATQARDQLRILDLERGILSDAIRRLYEAHAEGKITEEERERIAQTYKSRIMTVKEAITKDESLVALHELETMQEDLIKLFSDRFDDLGTKIDDLRSRVEVDSIREITIPATKKPTTTPSEKTTGKARRRKKESTVKPSRRTEAEKRIERIRAEVEKVLEKLGQMEIET
jgi:hypothetical protein